MEPEDLANEYEQFPVWACEVYAISTDHHFVHQAWHDTSERILEGGYADLMTDGCNMGVKSLHKYLNEYRAADASAREIAKKLVNLEQKLAVDIRSFL